MYNGWSKRLLAVLLSLSMVCGSFVMPAITAYAQEIACEVEETTEEVVESEEQEEECENDDEVTVLETEEQIENNVDISKYGKFIDDPRYKDGASWNSEKRPSESKWDCKGCLAYVADYVKIMYGFDDYHEGKRFTNINDITAGDIIYKNPMHWFVVLDRTGNSLYTAEGSYNSSIVKISGTRYVIENGKFKHSTGYDYDKQQQIYSYSTFVEGYHFEEKSVTFDTYEVNNITATSANVSAWMSNPAAKYITSLGFMYGTSEDNLQKKEVTKDLTWTRALLEYNLADYVGELSPGTKYYVKFYVETEGQTYFSDIQSFSTLASSVPYGTIETVYGGDGHFYVKGWVIDPDTPTTPVDVEFYLEPENGGEKTFAGKVTANALRTDIGDTHPGTGSNHGIEAWPKTDKVGMYWLYIYGIDTGKNTQNDRLLCKHIVPINYSDEPMITFDNNEVKNVTENSATVSIWLDNPIAKTISSLGFMYGTSENNLKKVEVTKNITWTSALLEYDLAKYVGLLKPETKYFVKYYAEAEGKEYISNITLTFVTSGDSIKPVNKVVGKNGAEYLLYDHYLSWKEAKEFCEKKGGHLVTITSEEEQKTVEELMTSNHQKSAYYIGLVVADNKWITGEELSYTNWGEGEPNNSYGVETVADIFYATGEDKYLWNDVKDTSDREEEGFILEYDSQNRGIPLESISLNKSVVYMQVGDTENLTVSYDPEDTTDSKTVQWSSDNEQVATVSDGKVTALAKGIAVITATCGKLTATCKVTVEKEIVDKPLEQIALNNTSMIKSIGQKEILTVTYTPEDTTDSKIVQWSSDNEKVATVTDGEITALAEGTASITATCMGLSATCKITVVKEGEEPAQDVFTIMDIPDQTYTGVAITPELNVYHGNRKLLLNRDYTVVYRNNVNVSKVSGPATVTVRGKGDFEGIQTVSFNIQPADMQKVAVENAAIAYNGSVQKKLPVLSYNNKVLRKNIDYCVESGQIEFRETGTYELTFKGLNNFEGSVGGTVTVFSKADKSRSLNGAVVKLELKEYEYTGATIRPTVTSVLVDGVLLTNDKEYEITYGLNRNIGKGTVIIRGINGYFGSKKVTFTIKKKVPTTITESMISVNPTMEFIKNGCTPEPIVKDGNKTLIKDVDYTVSYANNKKLGVAKVVVKGKGAYKGIGKKDFIILQKDIKDTYIRVPDAVYGTSFMVKPTITDVNGVDLIKGTDFQNVTYRYQGNLLTKGMKLPDQAEITVEAEGKGSYKGSITATFTYRVATSITKAQAITSVKQYTGTAIKLNSSDITVTVNGRILTQGVDYVIDTHSYKNNIKKGTASVVIRGLGTYAGEKTIKFKIKSRPIQK